MASCFNTSVADLEDELMILILDGQIQARIDSHNKVSGYVCVHYNLSTQAFATNWRNKKVVWALVRCQTIDTILQEKAGRC